MTSHSYDTIRRTVIGTIVAIIIGGAAVVLAVAAPVNVSTTTGVAIESSRDVHRHAQAPVTYTWNGIEHTEFISGDYIAGDPVTFTVTANGIPTEKSWFLAGILAAATASILTLAALLIGFPISDAIYDKAARARVSEYNDARFHYVH